MKFSLSKREELVYETVKRLCIEKGCQGYVAQYEEAAGLPSSTVSTAVRRPLG